MVSETEICVKILRVNDEKVCVEFSKLDGNNIDYHEHVNEIKSKVLGFADDAMYEQ